MILMKAGWYNDTRVAEVKKVIRKKKIVLTAMLGIKNFYRIFIKPTGNRNTIIVIIIYTRQNDNKLRLNGQNENFYLCRLTGYDVAAEKGI